MVIEIIPKKPEPKPVGLGDILFYLLVVIAIATVLGYFGLVQFEKKANKELGDVNEAIAKKETPAVKTLEAQILSTQKKINDFSALLSAHIWGSNAFKQLEALCHPRVLFTKFDLNRETSSAILSGQADSFEVLGQQIQIFEKGKFISKVDLQKVSMTREGIIEFTINITVNPQMFKERSESSRNP